jgi:hypothetical protein
VRGDDVARSARHRGVNDASMRFVVCAALRSAGPRGGGSVSGTVVDRDGPVVGAVVALIVSEAGPAPRPSITGGDGRYTFRGPRASTTSAPRSRRRARSHRALRDRGRRARSRSRRSRSKSRPIEVNAKADEFPSTEHDDRRDVPGGEARVHPHGALVHRGAQDRPGVSQTRAEATRRRRPGSRSTAPRRRNPRTSSTASTRPRSTRDARPRTSTTT